MQPPPRGALVRVRTGCRTCGTVYSSTGVWQEGGSSSGRYMRGGARSPRQANRPLPTDPSRSSGECGQA